MIAAMCIPINNPVVFTLWVVCVIPPPLMSKGELKGD